MTIPPKKKKCKANYKAEGATGCGKEVYDRTYGLCKSCYSDWLLNTPAGKAKRDKAILSATKERRELEQETKRKDDRKKLQALLNNVKQICHEFIRERDKGKPCVSCGDPWDESFQAGHWKKAELYSNLKFDERNIHGQCKKCNIHLDGNVQNYGDRIATRIGQAGKDAVEKKAAKHRRGQFKWDREILEKIKVYYRQKLKDLKKRRE